MARAKTKAKAKATKAKSIPRTRTAPRPSPRKALEVAWLQVASKALAAAVELKLFDAVGAGATGAEIARRAAVSERGAVRLLDALTALGLVLKEGRRYLLTADSAGTLVSTVPGYVGEAILGNDRRRPEWDSLAEVVRSGQPLRRVEDPAVAAAFFPAIARALYRSNRVAAELGAEKVASLGLKPRLVLDVAAGSAVWGIAAAHQFPDALVTALDFPDTLAIARGFVREEKLESRFAWLEGDMHGVALGAESYDLILLGHILHSEGEARSRALLARVAHALKPGAAVLIAEVLPDEARRERLQPLLFSLAMLLQTGSGDTFTLPEIRAWLMEAGFAKVVPFDAGASSPLILALKPKRKRT